MKRIIFVLSLTAMVGTVHAQLFGSSRVQNKASVSRVYLWDKPVTDSITYRGILPGSMRVVTMFGADATAYTVLFDSIQFVQAQNYFTDTFMKANSGRIIGYEYVVEYIGRFSWIKKKDLKKLSGMQKITAAAFNEKEKFTLMAQAPRTVKGRRDKNGDILLQTENEPAVNNTFNQPSSTPPTTVVSEKKSFSPPLPPVDSVKNNVVQYSFGTIDHTPVSSEKKHD